MNRTGKCRPCGAVTKITCQEDGRWLCDHCARTWEEAQARTAKLGPDRVAAELKAEMEAEDRAADAT